MSVVAVANVKGGVGKSVIATMLAEALRDAGQETLLVEGDECSPASELLDSSVTTVPLNDWLANPQKAALTIVDMAPANSEQHNATYSRTDKVVIVTTDDPASLMGAIRTVRIVGAANPSAMFALVVNNVKNKSVGRRVAARLTQALLRYLSREFAFFMVVPYCPAIAHCTAKRQTLAEGAPKTKARIDFATLALAVSQWVPEDSRPEFLPDWRKTATGQTAKAA